MLTGTETILSCEITGTTGVNSITWTHPNGNVISSDGTYTTNDGSLANDAQTATLTIAGSAVTSDTTFTCIVDANEGQTTATVQLKVYG